jgi:putative MFS transporter
MSRNIVLILLVASLGYFVDIYDLILFSIVRVTSLKELGFDGQELLDKGILLLNLQMTGMLIGGIFFGVLGDKQGRLKVLFGSILLYSVANFLNGYVHSIEAYAALRFIAGIGLAGELGAGITLVSEILPREKRGLGTSVVAAVGISGALCAWFVAEKFSWRGAYILGGVMGLALLFLRIGVLESDMFHKVKNMTVSRGNFLSLFQNKQRFLKYLACILVGVPLWYTVGLLMTLAPEFSKSLGVIGEVTGGKAIFYNYSGLIVGDLLSGLLSQVLKSRKKSILIFLLSWVVSTAAYFFVEGLTAEQFYILCFLLGLSCGYWAMFVTVGAEQFGTNLRATVATTTPNFVRGSVVLLTGTLSLLKPHWGIWSAGLFVGILCMIMAFWGYTRLKESFGVDLDFED